MTEKVFTDSAGDTLKVSNFGGSGCHGAVTVKEGTRATVFELNASSRVDVAKELLAPCDDARVLEGVLHDVTVQEINGNKVVVVGNIRSVVNESEKDYLFMLARRYFAAAKGVERLLEEEEKERQERLEANRKRDKRREELAKQFTGIPWQEYRDLPGSSKKAVDRIIELEEAAK